MPQGQKKLLIIGAYESEIEIMKTAREMGLYTIVTDNHTDWSEAPAKFEADEAWNISWTDYDALTEKCRESGVSGVMAGFSEKRVEAAEKLSRILGLPFYADGADLNVILDKIRFKKACIESGIVVPKSFEYGEEITFPVIVKPADNGGSRGISICYGKSELETAYQKALDNSASKEVLIEEYITCPEIMVYLIADKGEVTLSAMCTRHMKQIGNGITQLPIGYSYPSEYLGIFEKYNFENYKRLLKNLGITNGLIAFQAFVRGHDVIPFDPTYRLDGTRTYHLTEAVNGTNVLKMLINYSVNGEMSCGENCCVNETPYFKKCCFELPILLGRGTVTEIKGLELVCGMKHAVFINQLIHEGKKLDREADFSQIFCRVHLCADSISEIKNDIDFAQNSIRVLDENGEDMIIGKFDVSVLEEK